MKRKFIWFFFAMLAVVALGNVALATSWSTGQYNFQRTGFNPSSSIDQARLTTVWSYLHPSYVIYRGFPTEYNGRVFMCFTSFTGAPNAVQAIDINTGALLWNNFMTSTGSALRGTPTVATIDTTGLGDFGDMVYVARGSTAGGAGIRCIDAVTGLTRWNAGGGLGTVRYSQPALADTNMDGTFDIVIWGTEAGNLVAANPVTGVLAWGGVPTVLDAGYHIYYSPSLSTDNKVAYAGTYDAAGGTGHGRVHAVNTTTGAIINSFDPLLSPIAAKFGFTCAPIYVDDNTVIAMGYDPASPGFLGPQLLGKPVILDRNVNYLAHTLPGPNYRESGAGFFQGAVYPDPLSTDTLFIFSIENGHSLLGSPIMARAWDIPRIRTTTANPRKWNQFACTDVDILGEGPTAVANSPDGFGVTLVNSDGNFASADGKLYVIPNKTTPWGGGTSNFDWWNKDYLASKSIGFRNNTGNLVTDGVNDSGIVAVLSESYGFLHGMRNSSTARARWVDETFCYATVLMNVSLPLNGPDTDTVTFYNIGDASGSYSVSATPFAAASLQGNTFTKAELKPRLTSSRREELSDDVISAMTATSKGMFFGKITSMLQVDAVDDQFPGISQKSAYTSKTRETATSAGIPIWLTVTDLTGGGPVAPGGSADIELVASSATLGLGTYFADLHLTVAPNEPDPDFYGGTDVVVPITFVVGYLAQEDILSASDVDFRVTNFGWAGNDPTTMFGGGLVIVASDTVWDATYDGEFDFLPDADLNFYSLPSSPYVATVDACSTGYKTIGGASELRIQQFSIGLWDGAFCDSMALHKFVITNIGSTTCTLGVGIFTDWDLPPTDYSSDTVGADVAHQIVYMENINTPDPIVGYMRLPSDNVKAILVAVDNVTSVYPPNTPSVRDTILANWFANANGTFDASGNTTGPDDKSMVIGVNGIVLAPGDQHVEEYICFGWDRTNVALDAAVWKTWLRQAGYYRGDVNTDNRGHERSTANVDLGAAPNGGSINVVDIVYLANYYLKGTNSPWPFTDQGDVNCDGVVSLADVIYLANFVFKKGPAPIDKDRFLPAGYQSAFQRSSISLLPDYK